MYLSGGHGDRCGVAGYLQYLGDADIDDCLDGIELLGGTFALAMLKIAAGPESLTFAELLNTEKALTVILGIFLSVAIAFFFGTLVQYLSRIIFTFNYTTKLKWTIGLFGGIAVTAIIYFMLIKGIKDASFMTDAHKLWVKDNTLTIVGGCFVFFTVLMQMPALV